MTRATELLLAAVVVALALVASISYLPGTIVVTEAEVDSSIVDSAATTLYASTVANGYTPTGYRKMITIRSASCARRLLQDSKVNL